MGRPERVIDPEAGPLQRFAVDLRALREQAGSPSYRQLSRRAHFSATALSEAAGGEQLPSLAVTTAYVGACNGDTAAWEKRWREVAAQVLEPQLDDAPPYLGLAAFQPADAERFYGRESLVADLVERVRRQRFLGVFGPSGCGKSSLLRAGLIPALPAASVLMTPTAHPLLELDARRGARDDVGLLVVDQFEEVFTLCREDERREFVDALLDCGARVVLGCRADFLGHCATLPALVAALRDAQVLVGPMTDDELRRAIVEPAAHSGFKVEPELVSTALADVRGQAGALPLLSHALLETWRRRDNRRLTLAGYRDAGGVTGSIAATAERAYADLSPSGRDIARAVLLRLVQTGTGGLDLRRRAPLPEIFAVGDATETTAVVNALAAARLLVVADGVVELAHEALTREWPRLQEWITEDHERLRVHRDLTTAAAAWVDLGRDPGALYRGVRLAAARALAERATWRASSTDLEREFLDASVAHEETQRQAAWRHARRMRRLAQGLAALLAACVVIAAVAVVQRRAAVEGQRVAQSRQLALRAQDLSLLWPDDAERLAVSAYRTAPTAEARGALLSTAAYKTPRTLYPDHHGSVRAVAYSPDGSLLASAGSDRTVLLRNASGDATPVSLARHTGTVRALVFHPAGRLLVSAGDDEQLVVWDVAARAPAVAVPFAHGPVTGLAFSPDGRALVAGARDGTVAIWDTERWAESARVPHGLGEVNGVAFGAGGTVVAVAGRFGVTVFDRARGTSRTFRDHAGSVVGVALSSDARSLATGGDDSQVVLRDLTTDAAPAYLRRHVGAVRALEFAPDDAWLMSASEDGSIRWWSVPSGGWLTAIVTRGSAFYAADLSPDGRRLAAGSEDTLNVWPLAVPPFTGHAVPPNAVAFGPAGGELVTAGGDRLVIVWNRDGTIRDRLSAPAAVRAVLFHPDGSVVTGDDAGAVIAWDPTRRAAVRTMTGHNGAVTALALTRTGELIASGGVDGTVRLWEPSGPVGGRVLQGTHTAQVTTVAFSPDGTMLASGSLDGKTVLWDVRTGRQVATLGAGGAGGAGAKAVAFTPDGRRLAVGDSAATITLWDVRRQRRVRTLPAQRGTIRSLAISADGKVLAAAANDTVVTLWALDTGRHLATLAGHTGQVVAVAFGPAGSDVLASTGADPRVVLWNLDPGAVMGRICAAPGARCGQRPPTGPAAR